MGVFGRFCGETDRCTKKNEVVWADRQNASYFRACRALLDLESSAKHRHRPGTPPAFGKTSLVANFRVVPGFLENAFVDDNDLFQFTTKTKASAPENRRVETAMATNVPAKLSAAQIGAIHDPLSPPPSRPVPGPWATHRAKPPPIILLPPMLTKPVYVAWPLARPHSRA